MTSALAMLAVTAVVFAVLLIHQRGPWNLGEASGALVIRFGKWLIRVSKSGRYASESFSVAMKHLGKEEA